MYYRSENYEAMMDWYLFIKTLHIISSTILFGTGMGIAFFMYSSRFSDNNEQKYYLTKVTVLADYLFTFPAVIIQPLTGFWLINEMGFDYFEFWLCLTYAIYIIAGICWLPVVWIQIQLRKMLKTAINENSELPHRYHKLFRIWFILGWPAFIGLVGVFFLMVFKPL